MVQFFLPSAPLQPYIQGYWRIRSHAHQVDMNVFVDCSADLIFNFGVGHERRSLTDSGFGEWQRDSILYPQCSYPFNILQSGDVDLIGVRFRPGGLAAFVPMPTHELSNLALDICHALGSRAAELEQRLFDLGHDTAQQIALLNSFFLQRLNTHSAHRFTFHVAQHIEQHDGAIAMQTLSDDVGYSIRTVDRLFRQYFGISPKFYARIVRFQRALVLLSKTPALTLTHVAMASGYYDLAHFSKECSALTGLSAESYREFTLKKKQAPLQHVQFLQDG